MHRERRFQAWVQVSMGCNSKCAYCIVPRVRGREVSRRPGEIVAEVTRLAAEGVRELTLLGQNVNSWGRDLAPDLRTEFGELLRACDAVAGIERIRFTSPHPKDFREPVIAAIAECDAVCEHVHLPLQSGSSRDPQGDAAHLRPRALPRGSSTGCAPPIPDLALGTDIIVGFPGETEEDFAETLAVVEEVRYDSAFTFVYSPRAGTEAADDARPGPRGGQARADRAPDRASCSGSRPSGTPSASAGSRRCSSRGRAGPTVAPARPHAAQHDRELRRRRPRRATSSTCSIERRDVDDAARHRGRPRRGVSAVERALAWDGCLNVRDLGGHRDRGRRRRGSAPSCAPTACAS